jgi:hypothetical protein
MCDEQARPERPGAEVALGWPGLAAPADSRCIFDAHCHLGGGSAEYDLAVIGKNLIFNDVPAYRQFANSGVRREVDAISLVLSMDEDYGFVRDAASRGDIDAIKIHSRVQRLDKDSWKRIPRALEGIPPALPIIIDTFYYGRDLRYQPRLEAIIDLLEQFPDRKFVIAHCGGYRILQYFFHLREFENCVYDLSFALQYMADSSLGSDLRKLISFTDKSKLLFGSDFPFASPSLQYRVLSEIFADLNFSESDGRAVLGANALRLFRKAESHAAV